MKILQNIFLICSSSSLQNPHQNRSPFSQPVVRKLRPRSSEFNVRVAHSPKSNRQSILYEDLDPSSSSSEDHNLRPSSVTPSKVSNLNALFATYATERYPKMIHHQGQTIELTHVCDLKPQPCTTANLGRVAPSYRNIADFSPYASPSELNRPIPSYEEKLNSQNSIVIEDDPQRTSTPNDFPDANGLKPDFSGLVYGSTIDSSNEMPNITATSEHQNKAIQTFSPESQIIKTNIEDFNKFTSRNKQTITNNIMHFKKSPSQPSKNSVPVPTFTIRDIQTRSPNLPLHSPKRDQDDEDGMPAEKEDLPKETKSTFSTPTEARKTLVKFDLNPTVHEISIYSDKMSNSITPSALYEKLDDRILLVGNSPMKIMPGNDANNNTSSNDPVKQKYSSSGAFDENFFDGVKTLNNQEKGEFQQAAQRNLRKAFYAITIFFFIMAIVFLGIVFVLKIHNTTISEIFDYSKSVVAPDSSHQH